MREHSTTGGEFGLSEEKNSGNGKTQHLLHVSFDSICIQQSLFLPFSTTHSIFLQNLAND